MSTRERVEIPKHKPFQPKLAHMRFPQGHSVERHNDVMERKAGCNALAAVLSFTETLADSAGHGKWNLSLYDAQRFMRLVRVWQL